MARKKKKSVLVVILGLLLLLALAIFIVYKVVNHFYPTSFAHYPGFEIELPNDYAIHGIDVSRYQKTINWPSVQKMEVSNIKIGFAFMKATEGESIIDPQFRRNWLNAKKATIPRGAYHFFIASRNPQRQALNFIRTVKLMPGDFPPVLDVETLNGRSVKELRQKVKEWLTIVEAHYGVKPILYTNASFYKNYLGEEFDGYPLWVAHYLQKKAPRIERAWHIWQHSETGRVNGINAKVDFNVFNGDSSDLENLKIK